MTYSGAIAGGMPDDPNSVDGSTEVPPSDVPTGNIASIPDPADTAVTDPQSYTVDPGYGNVIADPRIQELVDAVHQLNGKVDAINQKVDHALEHHHQPPANYEGYVSLHPISSELQAGTQPGTLTPEPQTNKE